MSALAMHDVHYLIAVMISSSPAVPPAADRVAGYDHASPCESQTLGLVVLRAGHWSLGVGAFEST